jgi:hypothetical protein
MVGLVEGYAATLGWKISQCNVIVEGTSDVRLLWCASALYYERHQVSLLGNRLAVLAAGKGDDGGVDGLNRRLNAIRQIADADRGADGSLRFRFIGLYDNDRAGRRAVESACDFDRRLRPYGDLFLLHPVMPLASGVDYAALRRKFDAENASFKGLDWEIEDLVSERLLLRFEDENPAAILDEFVVGGRKHREFTRDGKRLLVEFVSTNAALEDLVEMVRLIRSLHDYHRLPINQIRC